jgi:hypothetical protein
MKRIGRKIAVPLVGVALATSGFAYLSSNTVAKSYAGTGSGPVGGYNVYNQAYTPCDTPSGKVCYASFDVIPKDLNHDAAGDAGYAEMNLGSGFYSCERKVGFGQADSLNRNYTATNTSGTGTPESHWICDLRPGVTPTTDSAQFMVIH